MKPRSGLALALSIGDEIPIDILTVIGAKQAEEAPISFGEGVHWFVVFTRAKAEFRAADDAQAKGFQVFLPTTERWVNYAKRKNKSRHPLFPRYFFAAFDPSDERWGCLMDIDGVEKILGASGGVPVSVPPALIEDLQLTQDMGIFDETTAVTRLKPGDEVRIVKGPLEGFIASLKEAGPDKRVEVLLSLFGAQRAVKLALADVRPA